MLYCIDFGNQTHLYNKDSIAKLLTIKVFLKSQISLQAMQFRRQVQES